MFTLLMYAVCLCLAFEGVQIFQIAIVSNGPWRKIAMRIGLGSLVIAVVMAVMLAWWFTEKGWEINRTLEQLATPPAPNYRTNEF